jgi:hypothetical protein
VTFTLTQDQYEALIALARRGAPTPDQARDLDVFLARIEKANGIVRHRLWIQWQETDVPLPPTTAFPETWPPELRYYLEQLSRPIARADVEHALRVRARRPTQVLVTPDPAGVLGWTRVEDFFVQ